jgi:hypothetical protein
MADSGIAGGDVRPLISQGLSLVADSARRATVNPSSEEMREAVGLLLEGQDLRPLIPRMRDIMPGWMRT